MRVTTARGAFNVQEYAGSGGPRVVLLHPLSTSGRLWSQLAAWLERSGFQALTIDLPAVGESREVLTIEDMAADVAATLDTLGIGSTAVVGMSMGGCIAQSLALQRPDLVGGLVLADTTSSYGPNRVEKWKARAREALTPDRTQLLAFQLDRWFSEAFRRERPQECERVAKTFLDVPGPIHALCCGALGAFDVTDRLAEIKAPTLVVVGEDDYATPPEMAEALAGGIPGAELMVVPGARHMALIESRRLWPDVARHCKEQRI